MVFQSDISMPDVCTMEIKTSFTVWECVGSLNDLGRVLQPELIKLGDLDTRGMPEMGDGNVGDCDEPKRIQLVELCWWSGQWLCLCVRLWMKFRMISLLQWSDLQQIIYWTSIDLLSL